MNTFYQDKGMVFGVGLSADMSGDWIVTVFTADRKQMHVACDGEQIEELYRKYLEVKRRNQRPQGGKR